MARKALSPSPRTLLRPPRSPFLLRTGGVDELPAGPHKWASSSGMPRASVPLMLRPSALEPSSRAGTLLGGAQPSSWLSCQRAGLMFPISSGAPALVYPEAPSLPLLGTRRRAQPAWPPAWTGVDVEAPHGGSGPSRQLQDPAGPRILCRGKRVSVRLWGRFWVLKGWSSFAEKSVGKGNPRETC